MAAREAYVRAFYVLPDVMECHPGVEFRDDDVDEIKLQLKIIAGRGVWRAPNDHRAVVDYVEAEIKARWPGRAYFIETEDDVGGLQVYQPFGIPREQ